MGVRSKMLHSADRFYEKEGLGWCAVSRSRTRFYGT